MAKSKITKQTIQESCWQQPVGASGKQTGYLNDQQPCPSLQLLVILASKTAVLYEHLTFLTFIFLHL